MFGGKGFDTEIKFAIGAAYGAFSKAWGNLPSEKVRWVDAWSYLLKEFDVKTINQATEYCVQNMLRSPALPAFRTCCDRVKNGKRLSDPIVSKQEEIARRILELSATDLGHANYSELADACLIVAAIASAKANEKVGIDWDAEMVEIDLGQRAEMFGSESLIWLKEGKQGKGYWCDFLGSDEPD